MQNGEQRQQASGPVTTLLPPPKALDTTGDVWRSWKTWRQEFELFATATYLNQQPKEVQAATFLMIIGEDARKTYSTLDFATDEEKSDVEVLKMKFEAFYKPALNLAYHEFRFGKCDQKDGESFNDWLTDLRVLAKSCEFGQLEERMLRSRIILGIRDKKLQEKLISENASFTKTVEMCRSREHGKEQCEEIQARPKSDYAAEMNALSEAKGQRCTKCAKVHQTDRVCPAKGRTCRKCGGRNHFAIACKKMQKRFHSKEHAVASVDAEEGDFWLETLSHARGKDDRWTATVEIEGKPIFCKLDTGATCSVIARSQLQKITNKQPLDCNVVLNTFFGFQKKATKQVRLEVATRESKILTEFFVVDDEIAVTLSGTVAEELGLLQRVCSVDQIELYGTAKPYEDVFEGLGQLEGIVYHLKLKPGSQGVVKPARRIPIALQSKVKAELDRMETAGVIVKVTEPTEWASNMVVVTKGEKVRICLDPSDLNKALLREHYPMPTLEDIAPSISGAQYFTTLDAASGFWQIKLDKESSKICTMCTPYGRYRFLRMPFGISSAPEIFQRAMHRVLEGLEGVAVVMDDILVWGRSREQHDANLEHVLRRCREYKLKLNRKKCRFLQESVRYLGHILTRDGLSLDPQRLEDILQVQTPSNQKELQTFLGMVSDRRLSQVLQETDQDPVMVKLRQYASSQWPESKADVSSELRCYWSFRDELHTQDGLVFRSNRLIIPAKMRSEVLACLHAAHGGAEKMKARARAVLFWPSINSDLEEVARRCETCQKHKPRNRRLPLMNHEIPSLPWEVVGADICYHNATEYLVVVDFYSFFFEIRPVKTTADKVIAAFADIFATHGFPQRLCTDNGPPFSSQDFREFVGKISLHHVRSSPYHPRSNGMAERAVQEAKKLLKRYRYGTVDFCAALLEWRNTPRDSYLKSPMQRLMGRNARTLLPVTETHLRPQTIPPEEVQRRLHVIRSRQRSYYNRGTRPLPGLPEGSRVTVYNVPSKTWSPATVIKPANSPRAYIVETEDGLQLQRTREHLRLAPTPLVPPTQEHQADVGPAEPQLRRSERNRRPPQRYPMPEL
ncbi:uncharacterized protein K02A2.6 isoform X3 [Rhipicephalus microplus]|uniref:uncharacterized protein K02A2.6 isoform X3 n=1 Tax=Rhipicephalus microplus TaxID=6941 RepID=UPI003F6D6B96